MKVVFLNLFYFKIIIQSIILFIAKSLIRSSSSRNYNEISVKTSYTNRVVEKLDNLNKSNKLLIKSSLKGASRIIEKVIKNRKQSLNQDL